MSSNSVDNPDDHFFAADTDARFLGHDKAVYGFVFSTRLFQKEFVFPFPPSSIDQDEPAATTITATQGGGKFIENQGSIFKDIIISGTTGFLPVKLAGKTPRALAALSKASFLPEESRRQILASISGYSAFMSLRSVFREYQHQLRNSPNEEERAAMLMYFINMKDNETWVVEPLNFKMRRSKQSPMLYEYNIILKTLAKGTARYIPPDTTDSQKLVADLRGTLADTRDRINNFTDMLTGEAAQFFEQFRSIQSLLVSIADVGSTLAQGINNIVAGGTEILNFPKTLLTQGAVNIQNVYEAAANMFISIPVEVMDGLVGMQIELNNIVARNELFEKEWLSRFEEAIANFNRTYGVQSNASSKLKEPISRNRDSFIQATPVPGETFQQFTMRVTGDVSRTHELAVLNSLRWPYFSPSAAERAPGTVAPGDPVLIPVARTSNANDNIITANNPTYARTYVDAVKSATSNTVTKEGLDYWRENSWQGFTVEIKSGPGAGQQRIVLSNTKTALTVDAPWTEMPGTDSVFHVFFKTFTRVLPQGVEETLGVDIAVVMDPKTKKYDAVLDGNKDLKLARGLDNLKQALSIKLDMPLGGLILHPWFGRRSLVGTRGTSLNIFRSRIEAEEALLSDSRVDRLSELSVTLNADRYDLSAKVHAKGGLTSPYSSSLL